MARLFLFLALIASLWVFPGTNSAQAGGCYSGEWKGRHCVAIRYKVESDDFTGVPKKLQEELSIFNNLAQQEKLGELKVESNKYNIQTNSQGDVRWLVVDGWVLYELANPKRAVKFIDALTALGYETMQHEQRPGCGPTIRQ